MAPKKKVAKVTAPEADVVEEETPQGELDSAIKKMGKFKTAEEVKLAFTRLATKGGSCDPAVLKRPACSMASVIKRPASATDLTETEKERNTARRKEYFFQQNKGQLPEQVLDIVSKEKSHGRGKLVRDLVVYNAETQLYSFNVNNPKLKDIRHMLVYICMTTCRTLLHTTMLFYSP